MASIAGFLHKIEEGALDAVLLRLYGADRLSHQRARYLRAVQQFRLYYGEAENIHIYSVPGRTELCGNHTDHQNGVALAAAVDRDIIAVAAPRDNDIVRVKSYGFDKLDVVDLRIQTRQLSENTHSASLIRGIGNAMEHRGGKIGGFDAYTVNEVLRGSGLSSSASFETMMGTIWNDLYNDGAFSPLAVAQIGQYAENTYFGKPSGLLDPLTCATGGILCVDLADEQNPEIHRMDHIDLGQGLALCITDTRGSHSELTEEFAQVRQEMEAVAHSLGCENLRQSSEAALWADMPRLRTLCGDRAVLRALHFYQETARSQRAYAALLAEDLPTFLQCITDSGHSAFEYNQDASCCPTQQAIPIALAVSESVLQGRGACRLQGSGFAGTIQAFVPLDLLPAYRSRMEQVFGSGCCDVMHVRAQGAVRVV